MKEFEFQELGVSELFLLEDNKKSQPIKLKHKHQIKLLNYSLIIDCSWEFQSEDHDVGFGLFYEERETYVSLIPIARVNSHLVTEDGTYTCDKPGTCMYNTVLN